MAYLKVKGNIAHLGKIASGKTTGAKELVEDFGYKVFSIAGKVKSLARAMLGREIDKSIDRPFLQKLGELVRTPVEYHTETDSAQIADWMANDEFKNFALSREIFNPYVWIDYLQEDPEFQEYFKQGNACIDDARFIAECSLLHTLSFTVVKFVVPEDVRIRRIINLYGDQHMSILVNSSETEVDQCYYDYELKISR